MKIEKINETQIKCTLSRQDLTERDLKPSELAYGSDKARALFSELMLQASNDLGFDAENLPLMIEAIPVSNDCLVLLVTKVEDPDELDTRFSRLTEAPDDLPSKDRPSPSAFADEILNCVNKLGELLSKGGSKNDPISALSISASIEPKTESVKLPTNFSKAFSFSNLSDVITLSYIVSRFYKGTNSLYKNPANNRYYLVLTLSKSTPEQFNKICNLVAEFSTPETTREATLSFYEEHYTPIIKNTAIQKLKNLK